MIEYDKSNLMEFELVNGLTAAEALQKLSLKAKLFKNIWDITIRQDSPIDDGTWVGIIYGRKK